MIHALPLFHLIVGKPVIVLGDGAAAEAKRRLVERAGGEVVGDERPSGDHSVLVVSVTARVQGALQFAHVIVNGVVEGPVHASQLLELQPKARITGNVHYQAVEMHQGAVVAGQLCPNVLELDKPTLKLASNGQ